MKKYIATYYRENPQLKNGGYNTERMIEANTITSARKKAQVIADSCAYGNMILIDVKSSNE